MSRRWFPLSPKGVKRVRAVLGALQRADAAGTPAMPQPPPAPPVLPSPVTSNVTFTIPPGALFHTSGVMGTASIMNTTTMNITVGGAGGTVPVVAPTPPEKLPVVKQDDLLQGTKYAVLSVDSSGNPVFRGTGYSEMMYPTETFAACGRYGNHPVPDPDCTCGFWVPRRKESALARWSKGTVALEVEMAGDVLECWPDHGWKGSPETSGEPWGYRAQWQRVLSVSLHPDCEMADIANANVPCAGKPKYLCVDKSGGHRGNQWVLRTACDMHVNVDTAIPKPVSWLREKLQTEIRPGTVTDEPPAPTPELDLSDLDARWRAETKRIIDMMVPTSMLDLPPWQKDMWWAVVRNGVQYSYEATSRGWEIRRISTPLLDQLTTAIAVQENLTRGLISAREAIQMLNEAMKGIEGIGG